MPTFAEGDRERGRLEKGQVKVPACYHRPYKLFREDEWTALVADPDLGGQGLPYCNSQAAAEYLVGANYAFTLYGVVGHAAGELLEVYDIYTFSTRYFFYAFKEILFLHLKSFDRH